MAQTKTKEELLRLSWLTQLRRQGHRQCRGQLGNARGEVCAFGLLNEMLNNKPCEDGMTYSALGKLVGLSSSQSADIVGMNDRYKRTFVEIADAVADWFK